MMRRLESPRPWTSLAPLLLSLLAVVLAAAPARADEKRGLGLARKARGQLMAGDTEAARALLRDAAVEWPDAPLLTNLKGDVAVAEGALAEATAAYEEVRASPPPREGEGPVPAWEQGVHHATFNGAVARHAQAEEALAAAGVPLDPAALPVDGTVPPDMIPAIQQNLEVLKRARQGFIDALDAAPDAATRESIAALNKRIEDLETMLEQLQQQQEDEDQEQQQDENQDENQDEEQDEEQEQDEQGDEDQEQQQQDEQDPQDQQDEQDPSEQDQQEQPAPNAAEPQPLSAEEIQRLLEQLEQLEERARDLERMRRARDRKSVEKDW